VSWDIGTVVEDRYEVTGVLGRGGMGQVHRVRHRGWGIDLAVKSPLPELFTGPEHVDRFVAEAQAWVSLGMHPNVCCCHYVRAFGGVPRMFAEYVPGGSLHERIGDRSLYRGDEARVTARILRIAGEMARGLEHAHGRGVLHRDVKPANVLLDSGDDGAAKITDFGLASARAAVSAVPAVGGATLAAPYAGGLTPAYASPEQTAGGSVGRRSDIYSLAVSVLEMFAGGVTWLAGVAAGPALAALLISGAPEPGIPPMPPELARLLERWLSIEPSSRPASMTEVAEELEALYAATGAPRQTPPGPVELRAAEHNNRALSLLDLGARTEAVAELRAALDADPQHVDAVYNAGLLRWRNGEITDEDLLTLMQVAREHAGDPWAARCMHAQVHLERGDLPGAGEILDDLARGRPGAPEVREALRALEPGRTDLDPATAVQWHTLRPVKFTRDGTRITTGDDDDEIRLWDLGLDRQDEKPELALSHDGSQLLIRTCRWPRKFKVLHVDLDKKRHRVLAELDDYVSAMAFTPDASAAVTAGYDHKIRVWDLRSGECRQQIISTAGFISALAFSRDGHRLLSSGQDDTVRLWDLAAGRCLRTVHGRPAPEVRDVWIRRSGSPVSEDETVRSWPLEPPAYQAPLQLSRPRPVVELSRLGDEVRELVGQAEQAIAASSYAAARKLLTRARAIPGHEGDPRALRAWRDLGRRLPRVGLRAAWTARLLSGQGWSPLGGTCSVSVSADARVAASALGLSAFLWDVESGAVLRVFHAEEMVEGVELSADGRRLVCAADFGQVRVWSVRTGEKLCALDLPYSPMPGVGDAISMSFTSDGRRVLLGNEDGTILLWDLESGRCVRTPSRHQGVVKAIWAGADGRTCVSAARDSVRLWDLRSGKCLCEIPVQDERPPLSVCLSPRGDLIVATWVGAPGMVVWNTAGQRVREGNALTARFSPDGRFIFAGDEDGTITVSDAGTGSLRKTLTGHRGRVWDVRLTPDGRYALSGGHDGTIRLWELDWDLTLTGTGPEHA
jgi:WD40 repeat protein/serine/threonine protein kinase